ncbi:MAG: hypothetical protein A2Y75_05505 [Candidatus Solincola sediminis]|uniref:Shikimate kinase n=1 Tax=Candidatus Solincola sediminis TaxID=1797199 RepID=A0A1F2WFV9_9ACTN|nr:MAG: hypothetical protein A2Y75_05505 [Candidatus Solincola sediminis]
MGAGKSTVGRIVASNLDMDFVDLDGLIATNAGKSISAMFSDEGENEFRKLEQEALRKELAGTGKVISCGGGIVLDEKNIRLLRERSLVFWLLIEESEVIARLANNNDRPLLKGRDFLQEVRQLMAERRDKYMRAAHEVIEVDRLEPRAIAEEITIRWKRFRSTSRERNTGFM